MTSWMVLASCVAMEGSVTWRERCAMQSWAAARTSGMLWRLTARRVVSRAGAGELKSTCID